MHTTRNMSWPAGCWLAGTLAASGGVLFVPGGLDDRAGWKPDTGIKNIAYTIPYATIKASISNQQACVTLTETVSCDGRQAPGLAVMPLPTGAPVAHAMCGYEMDEKMNWLPSQRLSAKQAEPLLAAWAKALGKTAILTLSGRELLVVPNVILKQRMTWRLTYDQPLDDQAGLIRFACPVPDDRFTAAPLERATVEISLVHDLPLRGMFSPTHTCEIERDDLHGATVRTAIENGTRGRELVLFHAADKDPMGLRVLSHRAADDEEVFFMLFGCPGGVPGEPVVPKDAVFVLDISGSMRGEKMEQARDAVRYCLEHLNPEDRFNIIAFASEVCAFRNALTARDQQALDAADVFVDELAPAGRTNIGDALRKGLSGAMTQDRPRIVIFVTDGMPTAGERDPRKILEAVPELNKAKAKVFVVGIGHDVHVHLLDGLAEKTHGSSEYIGPEEEIDTKIAALFERLSHPFLDNVSLDAGELKVSSVFPRQLPSLFRNNPVMVFGRYRGGGAHVLTLRGTRFGKSHTYTCKATFPEQPVERDEFIAPLWAARKIGYYLQEIRLHGENDELINEVVRLSRRFGIITEYTAFLGEENAVAGLTREQARNEMRQRLTSANKVATGKWAVQQAMNDQRMQNAINPTDENFFLDRSGRKQTADNIQQVGRNAFYRENGRWIDARWIQAKEDRDRKARNVKRFSPEYFELMRKHKEFVDAQELDGDFTIQLDEQWIEVTQ